MPNYNSLVTQTGHKSHISEVRISDEEGAILQSKNSVREVDLTGV